MLGLDGLRNWLFLAVAVVFLGIYLTGLAVGVEPELTLARAGIAAILLGGLARLALRILEAAPPVASDHADVPDEALLVETEAETGSGAQAGRP